MPITVKEITLADKDRFNAFLARHPKGHILQTWEWGEVKASTGWQPIRLLAERNGEPVARIHALIMRKGKMPPRWADRLLSTGGGQLQR